MCSFCKSILVRADVNLAKVGQVADLPPDSSPIQVGTEGVYNKKAFVTIGRIIYDYELGTWNEWNLMINDGTNGWLSDAQDEYVVTFAAPGRTLPENRRVSLGQKCIWDGDTYTVTTLTEAHYRGVEGELPFQYWDKEDVWFADLATESGKFATLDYSDEQPALYLGEAVEFNNLELRNLRQFEGWS